MTYLLLARDTLLLPTSVGQQGIALTNSVLGVIYAAVTPPVAVSKKAKGLAMV